MISSFLRVPGRQPDPPRPDDRPALLPSCTLRLPLPPFPNPWQHLTREEEEALPSLSLQHPPPALEVLDWISEIWGREWSDSADRLGGTPLTLG